MTSPEGFDTQAFFAAVDAGRRDEQLSWPALATVIWDQSRVLNEPAVAVNRPQLGF